jgi:hypothetical protein
MKPDHRSVARRTRLGRVIAGALVTFLMATSVAVAKDDDAERYDPLDAGHPLRIAAYVLHPVGVILDRLILRPAYWIGSHEPMKTLFGRTD